MKNWRKKRNQLLGGAPLPLVVKALAFQTLKRLLPASALALSLLLLGSELPHQPRNRVYMAVSASSPKQPRNRVSMAVSASSPKSGKETRFLARFLAFLAQANQAEQPRMQLILTVEKQVPIASSTEESAFEWQSIAELGPVLPGEILRYRLVGKNNGSESVSSLVLTQPIPPEMIYIIDSAEGANNITFSIDNGATFTANPTVSQVNETGQLIRQPAPPESYTHVRWNFQRILAPGQELVGTFKVKVK